MLRAAAEHEGTAFVEIFQNCNIYNDGVFDAVREDKSNRIYLKHAEPIRFGEEGERGVMREADGSVRVVSVADVGEDALLVHDAHAPEPSLAFALSRLTLGASGAAPFGVLRSVQRPVYDELMSEQLATAAERQGEGDLEGLLHAGDTWTI